MEQLPMDDTIKTGSSSRRSTGGRVPRARATHPDPPPPACTRVYARGNFVRHHFRTGHRGPCGQGPRSQDPPSTPRASVPGPSELGRRCTGAVTAAFSRPRRTSSGCEGGHAVHVTRSRPRGASCPRSRAGSPRCRGVVSGRPSCARTSDGGGMGRGCRTVHT